MLYSYTDTYNHPTGCTIVGNVIHRWGLFLIVGNVQQKYVTLHTEEGHDDMTIVKQVAEGDGCHGLQEDQD
uniref:Uncharacterized protein n=1 Tax=Physcomitrium patens TaxID=3218 RepID=A0A2K1K6V2_PHYPA|nr:hypothetical protein PHYPA_011406 [Physcomitrium patens]